MSQLGLTLIHKLKSGSHTIPIDADLAIAPEAFATYHDTAKGKTTHTGLSWRLVSAQVPDAAGKKGKYQGHTFEVMLTPDVLRKWIKAAEIAITRFEDEVAENSDD